MCVVDKLLLCLVDLCEANNLLLYLAVFVIVIR